MVIGKITGTIVATRKDENLLGGKFYIVRLMTMDTKMTDKFIVAYDTVGSGEGEVVVVVQGSSSRMTEQTQSAPVDASIVAVVDLLEVNDKIVFKKFETKV
ncbi:MAG: EutN/CcmL family microcompartment protein [Spirochaetes bacterium]|nr:EutN/CcmL family microcompartment protein [Spirochaetota bacterium]